MQRVRAFTLLEVMVVLAIIGGLMALASIGGNDRQAEDQTRRLAGQIRALFMAYRQEAVFQNLDLGVAVQDGSLQLLSLQDVRSQEFSTGKTREELDRLIKNPWQPYQGSLRAELEWPETLLLTFHVEGREVEPSAVSNDDDEGPKPALLFLSSDEYTPFELTLLHETDERFVMTLSGDGLNPPRLEVEYAGQ